MAQRVLRSRNIVGHFVGVRRVLENHHGRRHMLNVAAVRDWVESSRYSNLLDYVKSDMSLNVGDEPVSEILFKHDVNKLVLADMSIQELSDAASRNVDFCKYLTARFLLLKVQRMSKKEVGKMIKFWRSCLSIGIFSICI